MSESRELWRRVAREDEVADIAEALIRDVTKDAAFCLWLVGPLGAGKTTLTRAVLRGLGLPEAVPVTSPTYTYMNDYRIGGDWFAHLDLYRAAGDLALEELGLVDARPFRGFFVEWPERIPEGPLLAATHVLEIGVTDQGAGRFYRLSRGFGQI